MFAQFNQAVTVHRTSVGSYTKGVYTDGSHSTEVIQASVQPASPNDMIVLPEGQRNAKAFRLYTTAVLRLVTDCNPDRVVLFNEEYEVVRAEPWRNNVISHYKYVVTKIVEP